MRLLIPCASGAEASVKRQLKALGYGDCPATDGRISLAGEWEDIARLNVFLRSGERVLLVLGEFPAGDFNALYDGVFALPFEEFFTPHTRILMDGKSKKSALGAVKAAGGVAKKAIVERLKEKLGVRTLDEQGERAIVGLTLSEDTATVTLNTSGEGLHKRGYRVLSTDAPLKETIAACMIESSIYRAGKPFADLFTGSGTLPIEAAYYALRIAPGGRREFDFTSWKCAPDVLKRAREEAEDGRDRTTKLDLYAGDLSEKALSAARYHARRAGVERHIRFVCADMRSFVSSEPYGVIVSNPPYGERIGKDVDLFALYRDFGRTFRALPEWSCYFLSAYEGAERAFGGRAEKRRKLFNANLPCGFYGFLGAKPPKPDMK